MNIGIIGSGELGTCLASKLVALGHNISIANSRGPASIQEFAEGIGAKAVTVEDAMKNQVIIVSIPQKNIPDLPKNLFNKLPREVVVIDTGNYYPMLRDGVLPTLERSGIDSLWVQEELRFPIVKAFNAIYASSLNDLGKPAGDQERIAIPVSGDDPTAKEIVSKLIQDLGFDAFDVGDISQSWKHQTGSPMYCRDLSREELQKRSDAMGTDWSAMRDVITTRRRDDEILMKVAYLKGLRDSK
ncbi:NADPH-dependent F420 reductase [Dyadobacter sp. MSC1_007]|jgi:predicted dinucleotide-binding enzyme|uniref:NADPH-dependent F420 reductase n=1 Tax=Dyadobacter sp. MSC1_007 TaxID=2909264 RepID=UPI002030EA6E|nr:NAD(P)-binding domain-containing protein [Dyadobacter sp. MSC1_007]